MFCCLQCDSSVWALCMDGEADILVLTMKLSVGQENEVVADVLCDVTAR